MARAIETELTYSLHNNPPYIFSVLLVDQEVTFTFISPPDLSTEDLLEGMMSILKQAIKSFEQKKKDLPKGEEFSWTASP
jgi:hypothetical protein